MRFGLFLMGLLTGCGTFSTLDCSARVELDGQVGEGTATTFARDFADPAEHWSATEATAKSAACGNVCIVKLGNTDLAAANACAERCMPVATASCADSWGLF